MYFISKWVLIQLLLSKYLAAVRLCMQHEKTKIIIINDITAVYVRNEICTAAET